MSAADLFVYLSKILPQLVLPVSLVFLALCVLTLRARTRSERAIALAAASLLWVAGNGWVAGAATRSLEGRHPAPDPLPHADAIVVLGGGTEPLVPPRREIELNDSGDRLLHAARLHRAGLAPRVFACAGLESVRGDDRAPSDMAELLRFLGVPPEAILEERVSRNTYENAVEARRALAPLGVRRILLVSSALHMPRAVGLFEHQGFEVIPAPTDHRAVDVSTLPRWEDGWLRRLVNFALPNAESLAATARALREAIGIAVYRALGRLS